MLKVSIKKPILVTGATGYVAGWVIHDLLAAGATVHAAVRDPQNTAKVQHLLDLEADFPGTLKLFAADLLDEGSYAEAMAGCEVVFHTASPFSSNIKDPQKELIDPALNGTRNVLNTANQTKSVRRVVVTSSCAAIYGDNADVSDAPGGILTEEVWNTSSALDHQPYSYSKTLAERAAWEIAQAQDQWRLVVVNPSLVIGPGVNAYATSESFAIARQLGDGTMRMGAPDLELGCVDVRDLAYAHLAAGFLPDAEGRHIISGYNTSLLELGQLLAQKYPQYPLPKRTAPSWILKLVGPLVNRMLTRRALQRTLGFPWRADHTKSVEKLGVEYRPLADSIQEMFAQLIASGQLQDRR